MSIWTKIAEGVFGGALDSYLEYKKQKRELRHQRDLEKLRGKIEYEKAKSERAAKSEGYDADWEIEQIRNSGWKDEFTLLVLSVPLVAVFIPPLQPYIENGFDALAATPDWYRWLIVMIYAATWGIRVWRRQSTIA